MKWLFDVLFVVDSLVVMLVLVWIVCFSVFDSLLCGVRNGRLFIDYFSVYLRLCLLRIVCMWVCRFLMVFVVEKWKLNSRLVWLGIMLVVLVLVCRFDIC